MQDEIRFGTDGWRAVIADGFTFENVRRVAAALAVGVRQLHPPAGIDRNALIVGYDRRFLSPEFARAAADELARGGYRVLLSTGPTPSQTVSHAAKARGVLGGVVITASHNPASYNGIKFKGWYGGSGLPETYAAIAGSVGRSEPRAGGSVEMADILEPYVEAVRSYLGASMHDAGLRILHDPIYGVAAGLPARILGEGRAPVVTTIRGEMNPGFGGVNPEPIPDNIGAAFEAMRSGKYDLAICNDGDADRVGIVDETGNFVSPQKMIALLALYLVRVRGFSGELVKTFSTTRLIEKIAPALGLTLHETPIGFKYIADLMLTRNVLIGGEESGGVGLGSFLPERDGILSGLLVAECVAAAGKPLSQLVDDMEAEFGRLHYDRRDAHRPMAQCARLISRVERGELDAPLGGGVTTRENRDGVKVNFEDGSWILFRKSGTEPMIRIYAESPDEARVQALLGTALAELDRTA
jgi:phosphomannomutase